MWNIGIFLLLTSDVVLGVRKVRYKKARAKKGLLGDDDALYGFLNRITPPRDIIDNIFIYEDYEYEDETTTTTTTTTEPPSFTTPSFRAKSNLRDYCIKPRGQNAYDPDCHKFVDCWDATAVLKSCHPPNLVFDPKSSQCKWDWEKGMKERCQAKTIERVESSVSETLSTTNFDEESCSAFEHLGYICVPEWQCVGGKVDTSARRQPGRGQTDTSTPSRGGIFQPWLKKCPGGGRKKCCKKKAPLPPLKTARKEPQNTLCPGDFTGHRPFPGDCSKFVNCWKGRPFVQSCGPGTHFNALHSVCDWPSKANCQKTTIDDSNGSQQSAIMNPSTNSDEEDSSSEEDLDYELWNISLLARKSRHQNVVFPAPPSGQKVRLRGGRAPHSGYLEIFYADHWGFVCDGGDWTQTEANIVCKQLGFPRGIRSTTQGLVHGPVDEERKMTEKVDCRGHESRLDQCRIKYKTRTEFCTPQESIVAITCIPDSFAHCQEDEIPWGNSCYSVNFNRSTFEQAEKVCKKEGKKLVELTTQEENDLLSEMLFHSQYSQGLLSQVWTGGKAERGKFRRSQQLTWSGSRRKIDYFKNWWPGWTGERKGRPDQVRRGQSMGISLNSKFNFVKPNMRVERSIDYYFWALEDLQARLPFICERDKKDIGCIQGSGENYRGQADRGESGDLCLPWNSTYVKDILGPEHIRNLDNPHVNHCRNPDGDSAPWCIAPNGEFDYCDIPLCDNVVDIKDQGVKCAADEFQCKTNPVECVLSAYVCDGYNDCSNNADEDKCTGQDSLESFRKVPGSRLDVPYLERWLQTTPKGCAKYCAKATEFDCKSFNYQATKRLCILNELNIGMSGKIERNDQWDYYELSRESIICDPLMTCGNGKCLKKEQLCDGKNDCGENEPAKDEENCVVTPNIKVRINGPSRAKGYIEIKAFNYSYGGLCDDGFGIEEARVLCKMAGFPLGAKKAYIGSELGNSPNGDIILDELDCKGDEDSILKCKFDPWSQHDCRPSEWAGVECAEQTEECDEDSWRCDSGECISLNMLCDFNNNCLDGSDEESIHCESLVQARLAEGNNRTSGRVEIRYKGVWGTICDDDFGEEEGQVVCRMLGFETSTAIIHADAAFNPGSGPIWIHSIKCKGHEANLKDCKSLEWRPSYQCKHLEDVGIECIPREFENRIQPEEDSEGRTIMQCGLSTVPDSPSVPVARIAGGMEAPAGAHPWAASIRLQGQTSSKSYHWCGAVLLSEFHILTAAHCMEDYPKEVYRVRVGDWDMKVEDFEEQTYRVEAVYYHPDYNVGVYLNHDIALVKLKSDPQTNRGVRFGNRVVPACLPHMNVVYGPHLNCSVFGWGSMGAREPEYSRYLQSAKIPYLDTQICIQPHVYGPRKLSSTMFCAGYIEGGVDTCQGDSGGGLLCEVRGRQSVLGLTSWGYGCGRANRPGVYTKVADYLEWIEEKMTL